MPVITVEGARLHYRLDGPAGARGVLLCHSLGADLEMWDPIVPALAGRWRVLRYDLRGHGRSPAGPGPYTVKLLARDAAALVRAIGLSRPHVCGLSLGAMVALRLAADDPGAAASLVLCNTAAKMTRPELYDERISRVRAAGMSAVVDVILAGWFTPEFRERHPAAVEKARAMILGTSAAGYAAACAAVRDVDLRGVLARIAVPTLVVAGCADAATTPAQAAALAEVIPAARYVELATAHLSALEAGAALGRRIATFLEDVECRERRARGNGGRPAGKREPFHGERSGRGAAAEPKGGTGPRAPGGTEADDGRA